MTQFIYGKISAALAMFSAEHGLPNAISPRELAVLLNTPSERGCMLMLGRIFRNERIGLNRALVKHGLRIASYERGAAGMLATIEAVPVPDKTDE